MEQRLKKIVVHHEHYSYECHCVGEMFGAHLFAALEGQQYDDVSRLVLAAIRGAKKVAHCDTDGTLTCTYDDGSQMIIS